MEIPVSCCGECIIVKNYCIDRKIEYGDPRCFEIWFKDMSKKDLNIPLENRFIP